MMELERSSKTENFIASTMIWCVIIPIIHIVSLTSNIICICIFCSKTFIHKPIAIYFIGLLISDSITLLIGYSEMLDRETKMIEKSFILCSVNRKILQPLTDVVYTFMERFCLEWMLYKVLWTRASTILLAILSIQRSRTFFSLSYRETRFCAVFACFMSIFLATLVTCFEWIGVQCEKSIDPNIYLQIFRSIERRPISLNIYRSFLFDDFHQTKQTYPCLTERFNVSNESSLINTVSWKVEIF